MKDYDQKIKDNEDATTRWLIRIKRASNKVEKLRRQRLRLLAALEKNRNNTQTEIAKIDSVMAETEKPKKKAKPERRINL